jgi:hypothetical protein
LVKKVLNIKRLQETVDRILEKLPRPFEKRFGELVAMIDRLEQFFLSVKTFHFSVVRQWNAHIDDTTTLFQAKLSERDEGKANDCGKLELDILKLVGILESNSENRLQLAYDYASRLVWMGGDHQLTVERMVKFNEGIQSKAVHYSTRKELLDVLNQGLKRVVN